MTDPTPDPWAERTPLDAPYWSDGAAAWSDGYNAALAALRPLYDQMIAERDEAQADANQWRTLADDAIQTLVFADAHVPDIATTTRLEARRVCERYDALVARQDQPVWTQAELDAARQRGKELRERLRRQDQP
jgi:hypothetical protein